MKQLNGEPIAWARMYQTFEFTMEEVDKVLKVAPELQESALAEVLGKKCPVVREIGNVNRTTLENFKEGIGKSLIEHRERSLRLLAAPAERKDDLPF